MKDKRILNYWKEDVSLSSRLKDHRPPFLEMLETFKSISDGHLEHIRVPRHMNDVLDDDFRPVQSPLCRAGPPAKKFAVAEIGRIITKKLIEHATTEWAAQIMLSPKKDRSRCFCDDYQKLNDITILD